MMLASSKLPRRVREISWNNSMQKDKTPYGRKMHFVDSHKTPAASRQTELPGLCWQSCSPEFRRQVAQVAAQIPHPEILWNSPQPRSFPLIVTHPTNPPNLRICE